VSIFLGLRSRFGEGLTYFLPASRADERGRGDEWEGRHRDVSSLAPSEGTRKGGLCTGRHTTRESGGGSEVQRSGGNHCERTRDGRERRNRKVDVGGNERARRENGKGRFSSIFSQELVYKMYMTLHEWSRTAIGKAETLCERPLPSLFRLESSSFSP
jgi:hypothetical protein